jgi:hypothetical protein
MELVRHDNSVERDKVSNGELFGAGVMTEGERGKSFTHESGLSERPQVVQKRFAFLRKTQLHKFKKARVIV